MGYFRLNIEKANGYVPGFQPKEAEVIKLNTNENPYPPSPAVMKAVAQVGAEQFRRYPDPIAETIKVELPEGFQTAEFMLEHGFVDMIVDRKDLRIDYCQK